MRQYGNHHHLLKWKLYRKIFMSSALQTLVLLSVKQIHISSQLPATNLKFLLESFNRDWLFFTGYVQYFFIFPWKLYSTVCYILLQLFFWISIWFLCTDMQSSVNRCLEIFWWFQGGGVRPWNMFPVFLSKVRFLCLYRSSDFYETMFWLFHE